MVTTGLLSRGILALILSVGTHSQETKSCAETITARSGDTCASIAELAGISVSDFLRSNPSVATCSALVGGGVYCKSGTASSPPVSSSTDGTCGGTVSCAGSRFGRCCSAHGYCGSSVDHCGEGCQLGLGECGDVDIPILSEASTPDPATVVVETSTKIISATQIVEATVVITRTVTDTLTARASTRILTLTSVFPSTAIVTSTTVIRATSLRRSTRKPKPTTSAPTTTATTLASTGRGRPRPSTTITTASTTTTPKPQSPPPQPTPKPSPLLPKTPNICAKYDEIRKKDNCKSVASRNDLSLNDFYKLNPGISSRTSLLGSLLCFPGLLNDLLGGLCHISCEKLWEGYYVCTSAR